MPKLKVNNIEMYYEITGQGDPLLLIHGLGSSTRDWEDMIPFLPNNQIIAIDLRGHGQTTKPKGPYSIKMFANDIVSLLKSLNIQPVHTLGISLGGAIALQMAIDFPEFVKSIVVINSAAEIRMDSFKMRMEAFKRTLIVKLVGMKKMGEVLAPRLFIKPEQEEQRAKLIKRWAENDKKSYISAFQALLGWSVMKELPNIKCPALIVGSDEDYSTSEVKKEYTAMISNAKFVEINDARHALTVEKPEELAKVAMEFLSSV
ncbi:MAG: alpha/beta fold hydrolase [Promethearchaeota archaeon]